MTPRADARVPEALADAVAGGMPDTRRRLDALVWIPSISAEGHDPAEVRRSADETAEALVDAGLGEVRRLEVDGAHPYVYGEWLGAGDAPTVLLYAHHDVQPVSTADRWQSPPFEPTEREGRLFGRGAADDKAGIMVHAAAIRAWFEARGAAPVNVKVIIEGEEEIAFAVAEAAMGAAFGRPAALIGCGGTIPFVQPFSDAFGGAPCLLTGIEDPSTNAHGEDESLHLGDFEKACLAEALLLAELADRLPG